MVKCFPKLYVQNEKFLSQTEKCDLLHNPTTVEQQNLFSTKLRVVKLREEKNENE